MRRLFVAMLLMLSSMFLAQAEEKPVVIKLKSGVIVRGWILKSNPDNTIDVKSESGDIFVYREDEIETITTLTGEKSGENQMSGAKKRAQKQTYTREFNDPVVIKLNSGAELRSHIIRANADNTIEL